MKVVAKRFGDLEAGDRILAPNGEITTIKKAYDEHVPASMYRVAARGSSVNVSGNHLWYVETDLDRQMHRTRVRNASKALKRHMEQDSWECLDRIDDMTEPEVKTSLLDMIDFCDAYDNPEVVSILARIALSLGPIEEENAIQQDVETGQVVSSTSSRIYDAKKFSTQIRALARNKPKDVIVGQVVSTEQMAQLMPLGVNIPDSPTGQFDKTQSNG